MSLNRSNIMDRVFQILTALLMVGFASLILFLPPYLKQEKAAASSKAQGEDKMGPKAFARVRAPELSGGNGWFNIDRPLKLSELRGKIVLLDFWTYCCINCIHIVPELKKLEAKYPNELVVIGVHSAKFLNEKDSQNIRQAILRYEIEHPVVNDSDFSIWSNYGVRAWPTLALVDPEGYVCNAFSGEGNYEAIDAAIGQLITDYRAKGKLNEQPLKLVLERGKVVNEELSFPAKVIADKTNNRLFISDSNHNRIVVTSLTGEVLDVIGNGTVGRFDGDFKTASFNHPQGLALNENGTVLYVADTENQLLRRVDLKLKLVQTIAGTGKQAKRFNEAGIGPSVALNSPWDLKLIKNQLFIAMAGPHQIWMMDMRTSQLSPYAGTGREAGIDGPRSQASFAQPSGLAFDGTNLYVADSEISSIRAINFESGEVRTVAGSGDLFGFDDKDGKGMEARFQHPLGVEFAEGLLYIADTYNHKIKVIDPKDWSTRTLLGSGKPGNQDGVGGKFYEPGGLSVVGDKLYIADTNNHAIRVVDLNTKDVRTLKINGLTPPESVVRRSLPNREDIALPVQKLPPGKASELIIDLKLPKGFHLNPDATQSYKINTSDGSIKIDDSLRARGLKNPALPLKIGFNTDPSAEKAKLEVELTFYYCPENNAGACLIKSLVWNVPIEFDKRQKADSIKLQYEVK
jgi:DNA-binding beta-propeller fold protein YncE